MIMIVNAKKNFPIIVALEQLLKAGGEKRFTNLKKIKY